MCVVNTLFWVMQWKIGIVIMLTGFISSTSAIQNNNHQEVIDNKVQSKLQKISEPGETVEDIFVQTENYNVNNVEEQDWDDDKTATNKHKLKDAKQLKRKPKPMHSITCLQQLRFNLLQRTILRLWKR